MLKRTENFCILRLFYVLCNKQVASVNSLLLLQYRLPAHIRPRSFLHDAKKQKAPSGRELSRKRLREIACRAVSMSLP